MGLRFWAVVLSGIHIGGFSFPYIPVSRAVLEENPGISLETVSPKSNIFSGISCVLGRFV